MFFKENNQRVRSLSRDEEARLREAVAAEHWPLVAVAIHTGLPRSEQLNLRWEYIDFTTASSPCRAPSPARRGACP